MAHLTKKRLAILGVGGVLAVGLAAPAVANAADTTATPSSSSAPSGHRGPDQGEFAKALAEELGVDEQKVSDALTKVREQLKPAAGMQKDGNKPDAADRKAQLKERLDQAVKDGKLTRAEADAITKAADAGVLMGGGPGGPGGHR